LFRFGAKLIGQRHGAKDLLLAPDQHDSFASAIVTGNFGKCVRRDRDALLFKQRARADKDACARFLADDSFARRVTQL
jgi:hypothetical protein